MPEKISNEQAIKVIQSFDALPLERRLEVFRNLSPLARQELAQSVSRPEELIRKVSEEEMYFTVKEIGEHNALPLIGLTTGKQLTYLLDIDLWKKEMFDPRAAGEWLEILVSLGEDKILQFLQVSDPELIFIALNHFIKVTVRNPDMDLLEQFDDLPSFTLDDTFFIHFRVPDAEENLKFFLETAFRWNTEFYFGIMQELAGGLYLENEEMARKWRRARLSEKGFPEFDEALHIYNYLQRNGVAEAAPDSTDEVQPDEPRRFVGYPLKLLEADSLFNKSLKDIADLREKDRLSEELAHLSNKVMIADGKDPGSVEELHSTLQKVSGYINLALEDLCGNNITAAIGILKANHMEILFRRGFSLILDLRKEAQKLLRNYDGGVDNLGYPLAGLVKGLLQRRPVYAGSSDAGEKSREFAQLQDLTYIRQMMDQNALEDRWESI
jgi:hypothetical protein